jgi:hypothetical protein
MSEYAQNVVAQVEMEHKTAGLSDLGCRVMSRRATVEGILSECMPLQLKFPGDCTRHAPGIIPSKLSKTHILFFESNLVLTLNAEKKLITAMIAPRRNTY